MLDMSKYQEMTDVIHTSIPYSGIEHAIISTPVYNRLHRVLQSSLVFLTYPSNKVKRFEHSVGTMHLSGNIFFKSMCNSSENIFSDFMKTISTELISWRNNLNFEKYSFVAAELRTKFQNQDILNAPVPDSKFYNRFYLKNLKNNQQFSFFVTFQAIRLAGLLHDVGHLPYSHIFEHALQNMYNTIKSKTNKNECENEFFNIMIRFAENGDEIHEEIGKLLVGTIRNSIIQNIVDKSDPNIYFFLASFEFAEKIICSKFSDNTIFSDLHLITSSIVDADRMDYCSRDAFCSGINKSIFSYERVISTYRLNKISKDEDNDTEKRFFFCPDFKSVSYVEELLRRRKNIFSEINFHHRVHKHEILLEEVISYIGLTELQNMEITASLPHTLPLHINSVWKLISKLNTYNSWPEYQIIQLDDSWLDTLLKHKFFEIYKSDYLSLRIYGNDILWNRFDELISSTKRYHSLIKRSNDFREFDKKFFLKLINSKHLLDSFLLEQLPDLTTYSNFYDKYHSFVFNLCLKNLCIIDSHQERFFKSFESELNKLTKKNDLKINDCLLRSCIFSFGYKTAKTPLFLSDANNNSLRIEQISSQLEIFQQERAISPIFHVYYLPRYNVDYGVYENIDKTQLMDTLADAAINTLINFRLT